MKIEMEIMAVFVDMAKGNQCIITFFEASNVSHFHTFRKGI